VLPAKQTLELLRDVLRLMANFVRETGLLEKEHGFNLSELQNPVGGPDSSTFITSLIQLDQKTQLSFLNFLGKYAALSKDLQNPLALKAADKLALAGKLDVLIADLEGSVGVSRISRVPTDLDPRLVDRCAGKDYHDVVTNAFALLEDEIRQKLGVGREQFGGSLIDLAFSPDKGGLVLGQTPAEKEGIYLLFKGAFSFLRNPPSHTLNVDEGRNAALKLIHRIDLLIKLVDKANLRS
jgi:uncharacterized protein (TIGR02391 family)